MEERISNFITDAMDADLASGRISEIHTRFPPEPNGYLHIGSVKAIWVNWASAMQYGGKFNLRYDDTNPVKEDNEYVEAIEADLRWLGAIPNGGIFYGSDYFEQTYEYAVELIRQGLAYVCDLTAEQITEYRGTLTEAGRESPWRNRSVEENLRLFQEMKDGKYPNGSHTLRAKIDMASPNINLRDPVLYRILHVDHHRQGNKWCIYPMYDWAHTIQDAIEGITHSCCSIEFENHRPLYDWVAEHIPLEPKPHQYEFSRLNVTHTVMSKRYLRRLVEDHHVDGWDDPRMPTLCGLRRKGYTPSALFDFVRRLGVSKAYGLADCKLLEACQCEELNLTAPRRVAVLEPVRLIIDNLDKAYECTFPNNPNDPEAGSRVLPLSGKEVLIERSDFMEEPMKGFKRLVLGGEVRLMNSFIVRATSVERDEQGQVTAIHAEADLESGFNKPVDGRKVKGTIHWLDAANCVDAQLRLFGPLFTDPNAAANINPDNFGSMLNPDALTILDGCKLEAGLADATGTYQFVRTGYFTKDSKLPGVWNRTCELKSGYTPK